MIGHLTGHCQWWHARKRASSNYIVVVDCLITSIRSRLLVRCGCSNRMKIIYCKIIDKVSFFFNWFANLFSPGPGENLLLASSTHNGWYNTVSSEHTMWVWGVCYEDNRFAIHFPSLSSQLTHILLQLYTEVFTLYCVQFVHRRPIQTVEKYSGTINRSKINYTLKR